MVVNDVPGVNLPRQSRPCRLCVLHLLHSPFTRRDTRRNNRDIRGNAIAQRPALRLLHQIRQERIIPQILPQIIVDRRDGDGIVPRRRGGPEDKDGKAGDEEEEQAEVE